MATTKSKKPAAKKAASKPKTAAKTATPKTVVVKAAPVASEVDANKNPMKGFFARKFDANENILTIFKSPRIYGAIIGEIVGTMLLTVVIMTLGLYQPLYIMFGLMAVTLAVYGLSGANLNPIITVGQMASRRISAVRGVVYIVSQILGAWFGFLLINAFRLAGESAAEMPVMAEVEQGQFWVVTMVEFVAAIIFAFFFARATYYKRSAFTYAAMIGGGMCVALLFAVVISSNYVGLQNNFMINPAIALMHQILPTGGDGFGAVLGDICLALTTYAIFPMIGGVIGFYLSDVAARLSGQCACCGKSCGCACEKCDCNCGKSCDRK